MLRRQLALLAMFFHLLAASPVSAQWRPDGVSVSGGVRIGDNPIPLSNQAGGAYVVWRNFVTGEQDISIQHVEAGGWISAGWPVDGVLLTTPESPDLLNDATGDGSGGALVVWLKGIPDPATGIDAVVQRVLSNGSMAPGWPAGGLRLLAPGRQEFSRMAADGQGGAYLLWQDDRDLGTLGYDMYAQHVLGDGTIAPGWPADGLAIAVMPSHASGQQAIADGLGGAIFAWADDRNHPGELGDTYAIRVRPDRSLAPGWNANGNRMSDQRPPRRIVADGAGGFYLWTTPGGPTPGFDGHYYLQRITANGQTAPGWLEDGLLVCSAPGDRSGLQAVSDGQGGTLACWYDYRVPGGEIFALRVLPNGTLAPGWGVDGSLVSDPNNAAYESSPDLAPDQSGGAYIVWEQNTDAGLPSVIQHVTASGSIAPGWQVGGLRLSSTINEFDPAVTSDGQGGAIAVWSEGQFGRRGIWAQRYVADGIVAANLSLVSAVAEADRVRLEWFAADGAGLVTTLERRSAGGEWRALATLVADGTGQLRYEDLEVTPGERYAYRLSYRENGVYRQTAEATVEIPAAFLLTLEGFRPNPAVGSPLVSFTLPRRGPGRLELFDLAGRRVADHDLGGLPAGRHALRLAADAGLPPAAYAMRLTHDGRSTTARGVIIR